MTDTKIRYIDHVITTHAQYNNDCPPAGYELVTTNVIPGIASEYDNHKPLLACVWGKREDAVYEELRNDAGAAKKRQAELEKAVKDLQVTLPEQDKVIQQLQETITDLKKQLVHWQGLAEMRQGLEEDIGKLRTAIGTKEFNKIVGIDD